MNENIASTDTYENQICGVNASIATLTDELINQGHDVRILLFSKDRKSKKIGNNYFIGSFSLRLIDFRQSFKFKAKNLWMMSFNMDSMDSHTESKRNLSIMSLEYWKWKMKILKVIFN